MAAVCHQTPQGYRVGEAHHNAKLTNAEVSLVRTMRSVDGTGYRKLAAVFGVGQTTIAQICRNERRVGNK